MTTHQTVALLLDLAFIIGLAIVFGGLARAIGQPAVIGEIAAGIIVGPTIGHGVISRNLFPMDVRPMLSAMATVGVALFMFGIGTDMDHGLIRRRAGRTVSIAVAAVVLPFVLGGTLALTLPSGGNRAAFVVMLGVAMSVTAFPVLARVIAENGLQTTSVGAQALASAAVGDALAWVGLAVAATLAASGGGQWKALLLPVLFGLLMLARPGIRALLLRGTDGYRLALVLVGVLVCSAATDWIGFDVIFGAFIFGLAVPRDVLSLLPLSVTAPIEQLTGKLLLPIFFVVAGLQVKLTFSWGLLGELAAVLAVAVGGKVIGTYVAARLSGLGPRQCGALAVLMNTRGLTELIILGAGLKLGLLSDRLYSLMVVMAVLTTAAAGPLLRVVYPRAVMEHDRLVREPVREDVLSA